MLKSRKTKDLKYVTNMIYFIVVLSFVTIRICASFDLFSFLGKYSSYFLSLFTQVGLIFLLPFLLFKIMNKLSCKETFKVFNFRKVSYKTIIVSIVLGIVVFCLNVYVSSFFNGVIQLFGYKPSTSTSSMPAQWWVLVLNLICTAVLPAICEETLHRGMLLTGNSSLGIKKSIIISGFLFGLLHCNIEQFFYATIIGLFLGYVCYSCCSIYPCIIIHFMNNAISVFLSFAKAKEWGIGNVLTIISNFLTRNAFLGLIMFVLILCLLGLLAFELTKFLIKDTFNYNFGNKQKELAQMAIRESYFKQIEEIKNNATTNNSMYQQKENVIVVDAKEFLDFVNNNFEKIMKKADEIEQKENKTQLGWKTKIFLWGSVVLTAIITIMTFIWGLL